jgi:ABC-type amino acid transport substrate-binding protein
MGLFNTADRQKYFVFSKRGLIYEEYSFFTLKGCGIRYNGTLDELENVTIGVVQDYKYGGKFDNADFLKKENCLTDKNLLEKLLRKRFDIAIGSKTVIDYYAMKLGIIDKIEWLKPPVSESYSHVIAFSKAKGKQAEELARKFSEAIDTLIKNGTFKAIINKYKFDNKENSHANTPISIGNPAGGDK